MPMPQNLYLASKSNTKCRDGYTFLHFVFLKCYNIKNGRKVASFIKRNIWMPAEKFGILLVSTENANLRLRRVWQAVEKTVDTVHNFAEKV